MCSCCISRFEKCCRCFFVLPKPNNHWISRRRLSGGSSGFRRDGRRAKPLPRNAALAGRHIAQNGDVSTGNFRPLSPSNSEKPFLTISTMSLTPGGSPPVVLFHLGLCGTVFPAASQPGPAGV
jgi:hypothetical protein